MYNIAIVISDVIIDSFSIILFLEIILTIRDDLNVTMQVKYDDLRKEVNKAIEELFPKIK